MASFSAELIARLGLDTTRFQRGLASIGPSLDAATSTIQKKFSGTNLFKGLMQGIGIGSAQQIAELFIEPFRQAAEDAEEIAKNTERALSAMEQLIALRRSPEQNLNALERRGSGLAREAGEMSTARPSFWERAQNSSLRPFYQISGLSYLVDRFGNRDRNAREKRISEIGAARQENFLAQERIRKEIADKAEKSARELASAQKSYDEARQRRLVAEATAEGKVALAAQAMLEAQRAVANTTAGSKDNLEALTELEQKRLALVTAQDALSQERQTALEKEARQLERIADLTERAADAQESLAGAQKSLAAAAHDRLAPSLAQIAAGQAGTPSDMALAQNIQRDEATAMKLRATGNKVTVWDAKLGKNVEVGASFYENRALALRKNLTLASTAEQDPLATANQAVIDSEKHLGDILKQLEAVAAEGTKK